MTHVRRASPTDAPALAAAVRELLAELGGEPPPPAGLCEAARALASDPDAGVLLIAETGGTIVGVLGASWPMAVHVPGTYALIQELWVDPAWRRRAVADELMRAFVALVRERGIERVEVGLPRADFLGIHATAAFYRESGFRELGVRMRRTVSRPRPDETEPATSGLHTTDGAR
ncbi:MAG TPA: GNAT family N-acetyltransferase [Solirubrobacteraceae bacterium]|nr:GNAT family N-acetyltransferase [Solirubrobacteraceae bacterium]